jgi:hypothetical protein
MPTTFTKRAIKITSDNFWFAIVYTIVEHEEGGREMQLWAVRAENNEAAINEWLSKQPKE